MTKIFTVLLTLGLFLGNVEADVRPVYQMKQDYAAFVQQGRIDASSKVHPFYKLSRAYADFVIDDPTFPEKQDITDTLSEMFRSGYGWWGGWDYTKVASEDEQKAGLSALRTLGTVVRDEVAQGFVRYARQDDIPTNLKGHYGVVSTILFFGNAMQNPFTDVMRQIYSKKFKHYSKLMGQAGISVGRLIHEEWESLKRIRQEIYVGGMFDYGESLPTFTTRVMTEESYDELGASENAMLRASNAVKTQNIGLSKDDQAAAFMFKGFKNRFDTEVYGPDRSHDNAQRLAGLRALKQDYSEPKLTRPQNAYLARLYDQISATLDQIINFLENGGLNSVLRRKWKQLDASQAAPDDKEAHFAAGAPTSPGMTEAQLKQDLLNLSDFIGKSIDKGLFIYKEAAQKLRSDIESLAKEGDSVKSIPNWEDLLNYKADRYTTGDDSNFDVVFACFAISANQLYFLETGHFYKPQATPPPPPLGDDALLLRGDWTRHNSGLSHVRP